MPVRTEATTQSASPYFTRPPCYVPIMNATICPLCVEAGGEVLLDDGLCRVIRVKGNDEARDFPGFCRVVWTAHVAEMSELTPSEQIHLLRVVMAVELSLRKCCQPDKINLASLGNVVSHLHWHVIPRWRDDSHFPAPIWAGPRRTSPERAAVSDDDLRQAIVAALASSAPHDPEATRETPSPRQR